MNKSLKSLSYFSLLIFVVFLLFSCSGGVENTPAAQNSTKAFQIGSSNEFYDSLQQAVQSLKDKSKAGAKAASESYTIRLNWDKTDPGATISEIDAEVKLDFQGHTLTLSDGSEGIVIANTGKAVEIANGTVQVARGATLKAGTTAVITASSDTTLSASVNASNTEADAITTTGGSFNIQGAAKITSKEDKRTIVATETSVIKVNSSQVVLTGGMKLDGNAAVDLGDAKLKLTKDIEKGDECKLEVKAENVEPQNDNVHQDKIEEAMHNHSFSSVWTYDTTNHWHASTCGHNVVTGESEHKWNDGVVTTEAIHKTEGVRTYTCTVCGATRTESIPALADAHTYAEEWTTDATYHWHDATCGHEVISGKAEHSWDNGAVTTEATHTADGVRTYTCTVCKATKTEVIPAWTEDHTFSTGWTYDTTNHWHASTCGHNVVSGESEHTWNDGAVTTAPTHTEEGVRTYTCTVCGATRTETIPASVDVHTYSNEWTKDETYHWHDSTCGHNVISGKAEHSWNNGAVTTEATHTTDGVRTYTCTVCSATRREIIPAAGHSFSEEWCSNDYYHWHESTCGDTDEKSSYGRHEHFRLQPDGTYLFSYTCSVCGKQKQSNGVIGCMGPGGGVVFYAKREYSNGWRYLETTPNNIHVVGDEIVVDPEHPLYFSEDAEGSFVFGIYRLKDNGKNMDVFDQPSYLNDSSPVSGKKNTYYLNYYMGERAYVYFTGSQTTNNYAAKLCDDLSFGGFSDWVLPTPAELNHLFENATNEMIVFDNTGSGDGYWTSSEDPGTYPNSFKEMAGVRGNNVSAIFLRSHYSDLYGVYGAYKGDKKRVRPIRYF